MTPELAASPQAIGHYRILRALGIGAMGEVYEAEDLQLGRHVALKRMSARMAAISEYRERFRREAVSMAKVRHPNVVQVYDLGLEEDLPYFTMELVDGGDCATFIENQRHLTVPDLAKMATEAALGLGAAAQKGIVHRDVKPANLLIHQGQVKVVDFGIARAIEMASGLTQYGMVMGTPEYMAPEQAMGLPVDLRADIYALGLSLFHLVTLSLPFVGEESAVLQAQVSMPLPNPRLYRPDLPDDFCEVLQKMVEKDPRQRHQTYEELGADLAPLLLAAPPPSMGDTKPGSLLLADGSPTGRQVTLPFGEFVVGREVGCHLVLDDAQASRRHASFTRTIHGLSVFDLGSRNGVRVNANRVSQAELKVGDQVQVGSTTFQVLPVPASRRMSAIRPPTSSGGLAEARGAFLARLARDITGATPAQSILQVLPELLRARPPLLPVDRLVLVRRGAGQPTEVITHRTRTGSEATPVLTALIEQVCAGSRSTTLEDARTNPRCAAESPGVAFVLCCPLVYDGQSLGALYVDSTAPHTLTPAEASFFEAVGHLVSAALHPCRRSV